MRTLRITIFPFLALVFISAVPVHGQTKAEKKVMKKLRADISFLASDDLEGRRTGSRGEEKAANYIISRYQQEKIPPYNGTYKHPFHFVYGRQIGPRTVMKVAGVTMKIGKDAFPLPFSANTAAPVTGEVLPDVFEHGNIWMISLYANAEDAQNPHFDGEKVIYERAREAKKQGASAVVFYGNYPSKYPPTFHRLSEFESLDLPVFFLNQHAFETFVQGKPEGVLLTLVAQIEKTERTGSNVAAYIDNKAPYTVVLGAHYDHLGYGEDGNTLDVKSRTAGNAAAPDKSMIHNGADDNASGTAGLLELASRIRKNKLRNYNYLFVNFSGEELGLLGSKAFVKDNNLDSNHIAYMVNMDMIGRLNDSTHALTVGGIGTSPQWGSFVGAQVKNFKIVVDSSGIGPSDHTSFYTAGIPVLFFFTGIHHDYHKPSDDAEKINYYGEAQVLEYIYSIVAAMDKQTKPLFTPTKQSLITSVRFKVTLGIMPDYSFQDEGVRVDDVIADRPASKAGIQQGDIIIQLGKYPVKGMQSYMEALSKFELGQSTEATVLRKGKPLHMKITF